MGTLQNWMSGLKWRATKLAAQETRSLEGCLESCYLQTQSIQPLSLTMEVSQSLVLIGGVHTQSELAAIPYKICFCGNIFEVRYNCSSMTEIVGFKGETFHVLAKAVGQYGFASPAVVRTRIPQIIQIYIYRSV